MNKTFDWQKHEELHAKLLKQQIMLQFASGWGKTDQIKLDAQKTMYNNYTAKMIAEQYGYSSESKKLIIERYTLLADFYAWSIFHQDDNAEDCLLRDSIFPRIREYLLDVVHLAVLGEVGHFDYNIHHLGRYFGQGKQLTQKNVFRRFQLQENFENGSGINERLRERQVRGCKTLFKNTKAWRWSASYGGPAWERICDRWLKLEKHSDRESIDQLIDCCHNTGNVLNKSLYGIDTWLGIKTKNKDSGWLIDQCSFPRYAYSRIYEEFHLTKEDFSKLR